MSQLQTNLTNLQAILNNINNLPETGTENLDTEISTQSTLLSEQEAKIAELAQVLAGKAGGENGNLNVANIIVNASYGTTFRYVGPDGLATLSGAFGNSTIQVIIPSICFIKSSNNGAAGFINYSTSGGCSTLFNNGFYACVEITSSGATIIAPSGTNSGGSSG